MTLNDSTLMLGVMALCLIGVAFQAWRMGNERRDVALLGVLAAVCAAGTGVLVAT